MSRAKNYCALLVLPAPLFFLLTAAVSAASSKKLTYEQAYKACRTMLSREAARIDTKDGYIRYGACMAKFGYNL